MQLKLLESFIASHKSIFSYKIFVLKILKPVVLLYINSLYLYGVYIYQNLCNFTKQDFRLQTVIIHRAVMEEKDMKN